MTWLRRLLAHPVEKLDAYTHTRLGWLPFPVHDLICTIYDWSLGLTWREARS